MGCQHCHDLQSRWTYISELAKQECHTYNVWEFNWSKMSIDDIKHKLTGCAHSIALRNNEFLKHLYIVKSTKLGTLLYEL